MAMNSGIFVSCLVLQALLCGCVEVALKTSTSDPTVQMPRKDDSDSPRIVAYDDVLLGSRSAVQSGICYFFPVQNKAQVHHCYMLSGMARHGMFGIRPCPWPPFLRLQHPCRFVFVFLLMGLGLGLGIDQRRALGVDRLADWRVLALASMMNWALWVESACSSS